MEIIKLNNSYIFDIKNLKLSQNGYHIPLTKSKSKLIEILVKNLDSVVSYAQITSFIWGEYREPSTLRSLVYRTK